MGAAIRSSGCVVVLDFCCCWLCDYERRLCRFWKSEKRWVSNEIDNRPAFHTTAEASPVGVGVVPREACIADLALKVTTAATAPARAEAADAARAPSEAEQNGAHAVVDASYGKSG